jgi:hypothetical protein
MNYFRLSRIGLYIAVLIILPFILIHGQEPKAIRSSEITINGLDLPQIMERIATSSAGNAGTNKDYAKYPTIIWLIDNTTYLKNQKCADLLTTAISKGFSKNQSFNMSVVKYASKPEITLENGTLKDMPRGIESVFKSIDDDCKDPCSTIRFCVDKFKKNQTKKHIVLFTIQNNDIESDLEDTLKLLNENNFTLNIISGGAIMSNSNTDAYGKQPENTTIYRAESAEIELDFKNPHLNWWYPKGIPSEGVKSSDQYYRHKYPFYTTFVFSGYGIYGLSRLAAYSNGKYYLYYLPSNAKSSSFCELHLCSLCEDKKNHSGGTGCNTNYNKFLPAMAPVLLSRDDYSAKYGSDPMYLLLTEIKEKSGGCWLPTGLNTIFDGNGGLSNGHTYQIDRSLQTMDEMIKKLADTMAENSSKGDVRFQAHCTVEMANLYIEKFNLIQFKYYVESNLVNTVKNKSNKQDWGIAYLVPIFECFCHIEESADITYQQKKAGDYAKASELKPKIKKAVNILAQRNKIESFAGAKGEEDLANAFEAVAKVIMNYKGTPWELVARRLPFIVGFRIEFGVGGDQRTNLKPGEPPPPAPNQTPGLTPTQTGPRPTESGH